MSIDDVYVALRDLLKARLTSWNTREAAVRAVEKIHREALAKTLLEPTEPEQKEPKKDDSTNAA